MKTINHFMILFFIALVISPTQSFGGGQDLGGGDSSEIIRPSESMLVEKLNKYHSKRKELMNFIQLTGTISERILGVESGLSQPLSTEEKLDFTQNSKIFRKIFSSNNDFTKLKEIRIIFEGICLDGLGEEKDAVANLSQNSICWNKPRLLSKLTTENYELELLALYGHELSHLFKTNEEEAQLLQGKIKGLGPNFKKYLGFMFEEKPQLRDQIQNILNLIVDVKNTGNKSLGNICSKLYELKSNMLSIFQRNSVESAGISELGFNQAIAFHTAFVHSQYLPDYCDLAQSILHRAKFNKANPAAMRDLYPDPVFIFSPLGSDKSLIYSQYILADLSDSKITWIPYAQVNELNQDLDQIISLLTKALVQF